MSLSASRRWAADYPREPRKRVAVSQGGNRPIALVAEYLAGLRTALRGGYHQGDVSTVSSLRVDIGDLSVGLALGAAGLDYYLGYLCARPCSWVYPLCSPQASASSIMLRQLCWVPVLRVLVREQALLRRVLLTMNSRLGSMLRHPFFASSPRSPRGWRQIVESLPA